MTTHYNANGTVDKWDRSAGARVVYVHESGEDYGKRSALIGTIVLVVLVVLVVVALTVITDIPALQGLRNIIWAVTH